MCNRKFNFNTIHYSMEGEGHARVCELFTWLPPDLYPVYPMRFRLIV